MVTFNSFAKLYLSDVTSLQVISELTFKISVTILVEFISPIVNIFGSILKLLTSKFLIFALFPLIKLKSHVSKLKSFIEASVVYKKLLLISFIFPEFVIYKYGALTALFKLLPLIVIESLGLSVFIPILLLELSIQTTFSFVIVVISELLVCLIFATNLLVID